MRIPSFEECPRLGLIVLGGTVYPSLTCFSTVGKMTTALVSQSSHGTRDLFFHPSLFRSILLEARKVDAGSRESSELNTDPTTAPSLAYAGPTELGFASTSLTRQRALSFLSSGALPAAVRLALPLSTVLNPPGNENDSLTSPRHSQGTLASDPYSFPVGVAYRE